MSSNPEIFEIEIIDEKINLTVEDRLKGLEVKISHLTSLVEEIVLRMRECDGEDNEEEEDDESPEPNDGEERKEAPASSNFRQVVANFSPASNEVSSNFVPACRLR